MFSTLYSLIFTQTFTYSFVIIFMGFLLRSTLVICGHLWVRTKSQTLIFMILPFTTFMITKVISGNIALSLGMVGALSIVRFRNPVKNSFELVMFFVLISIGITSSVSLYYTVGLTFFVIVIVSGIEILEKIFSYKNKDIFSLSFKEGESLTYLELELKKEHNELNDNRFLVQSKYDFLSKKFIYKFASSNRNDIRNLHDELLKSINKENIINLEYVYN